MIFDTIYNIYNIWICYEYVEYNGEINLQWHYIYILFMDVKGNIMEYHGIILIECI